MWRPLTRDGRPKAKDDITSPDRSQRWTLDPLGNWDETDLASVTETRVHNTVNELTSRTVGQDPQISLTYDDAGNLTQDGDCDGDHKYTWDYRNRLVEVKEKQAGQWVTIAECKYDAKNWRILKVVTNKESPNGTTRFLWGGPAPAGWQCRCRRPLGRREPLHLHRLPRGRRIRPHAVQTSVLRPDARPRHERGSEIVSWKATDARPHSKPETRNPKLEAASQAAPHPALARGAGDSSRWRSTSSNLTDIFLLTPSVIVMP